MHPQEPKTAGAHETKTRSVARLILSVTAFLSIAAGRSLMAFTERPEWFSSLRKPSWIPPDPVFPIIWVSVYSLLGVILWRLWDRTPVSTARNRALSYFWAQSVLNVVWIVLFFGLHQLRVAVVDIFLMAPLAVLATMAAFQVDRVAGRLLACYLVWVAFAMTLNVAMAILNT